MEKTIKPIKVVHITSRYLEFNAGVKQVLRELLAAQNALDELDVWIYGSNSNRLISPQGEATPAEIDDLLALKPDLAIFHSIYIPRYHKVAKALTKAGIPYLVEPHGSLDRRAQAKSTWKKKLAHLLWVDSWIRQAQAVIFLCEEERKASRVSDVKSEIIPNTFPTVFQLVEAVSPMHNPVKLMMLGRIDPFHKGMDRFFDTLRALPDSLGADILVELYGFGSDENLAWMQEQIKTTDSIKIQFKGSVFKEEKTEAFKNADIFCLFSRYEGLPLTLYEAAASGLPILVTEGSNRVEWVDANGNGWVLWDQDEEKWGEKMAQAIDAYRNDSQSYKEKALQSAKELPTWDDIARQSIDIYRKWGRKS
jgi:glycosyltransferase involved in cell wall biosynthesis